MKPLEFYRLSRRDQIRHMYFDRDGSGRLLFMPLGSSEATFRLAYYVPSEQEVDRLIARVSFWSRATSVVLFTLLLVAIVFMVREPDRIFSFWGPGIWIPISLVVLAGSFTPYVPGLIALYDVGPFARAPRTLRDVARHHDRVRLPTGAVWLLFAMIVAALVFQGAVAYQIVQKGHIEMAIVLSLLALVLAPFAAVFPLQVRMRRMREEHERLESVVGERTAELEDLNRTLEERVAAQVRDIERLAQLKHFFAAPVAEVILSGADPAKVHRRELSVVCVDLRGFTAFSETAEPEEVISVLRIYHAELGILVNRYQATLEHFAGDGALIFLNDPIEMPDHPRRALKLATELRAALRPHLEEWRRQGFDLGMGAGVAVGYATIGAIGYEGRWEYAAIGNVCNLAARLCSEAKDGQVVTTHRVGSRAGPGVELAALGERSLKGFVKPVAAFDVLGIAAP